MTAEEAMALVVKVHDDHVVVMQAAWIEWKHGRGAESAMEWIENTLEGPGLLPDDSEPWATEAQAYFDANRAEPYPICSCGRPSHIACMGLGFCSDEHYRVAEEAGLLTPPPTPA